jgi:Flp pilus assembly pilin Flp
MEAHLMLPRIRFRSLVRGEGGATAVEYGLMVAFIGGVIIVTVMALGGPVMGLYERVNWW